MLTNAHKQLFGDILDRVLGFDFGKYCPVQYVEIVCYSQCSGVPRGDDGD